MHGYTDQLPKYQRIHVSDGRDIDYQPSHPLDNEESPNILIKNQSTNSPTHQSSSSLIFRGTDLSIYINVSATYLSIYNSIKLSTYQSTKQPNNPLIYRRIAYLRYRAAEISMGIAFYHFTDPHLSVYQCMNL